VTTISNTGDKTNLKVKTILNAGVKTKILAVPPISNPVVKNSPHSNTYIKRMCNNKVPKSDNYIKRS
jgi:hypothetical protein